MLAGSIIFGDSYVNTSSFSVVGLFRSETVTHHVQKTSYHRNWRIKVLLRSLIHPSGSADIYGRGIGFAVATILIEKFNSNVVAISRTKTPELLGLMKAHSRSLLAIECDVSVCETV